MFVHCIHKIRHSHIRKSVSNNHLSIHECRFCINEHETKILLETYLVIDKAGTLNNGPTAPIFWYFMKPNMGNLMVIRAAKLWYVDLAGYCMEGFNYCLNWDSCPCFTEVSKIAYCKFRSQDLLIKLVNSDSETKTAKLGKVLIQI